jgi:hypothetical protein
MTEVPATTSPLSPAAEAYIAKFKRPGIVRWFFIRHLPTLWWWGGKIDDISGDSAKVSIPYSWRTQNPFKSTYFAAQAGAAELSTGMLVLIATQDSSRQYSTLITRQEGDFLKKATQRVVFQCEMGAEIRAAVERATTTGKPQTIDAVSRGIQADGVEVSRFVFRWSILAK